MAANPKRKYTLEEYFDLELTTNERYEYFDGDFFCMSGVSEQHAQIETNAITAVANNLEGSHRRVFPANMLPMVLAALAIVSCGRGERATVSNSPASTQAVKSKQSVDTATCVNLNGATSEELAQLPGVGEVIAERIISYRQRHGPFRRPEQVIIIEGLSEKKYRAVEKLICVD